MLTSFGLLISRIHWMSSIFLEETLVLVLSPSRINSYVIPGSILLDSSPMTFMVKSYWWFDADTLPKNIIDVNKANISTLLPFFILYEIFFLSFHLYHSIMTTI